MYLYVCLCVSALLICIIVVASFCVSQEDQRREQGKAEFKGVWWEKNWKRGVTNVAGIVGPPLSPSFVKKRLWVFQIFPKRGGSDFSYKKGGVGKKEGALSRIFMLTNSFQSYLLRSEWWFVFCLFAPYLSVSFVFHGTNLVLGNLINRYVTSVSSKF